MRGVNWLNVPIRVANLSRQVGGNMGSAPDDISKAWDAFYRHWVHPVVHFGTPMLIVFAVLMTLAVVATPVLVGIDTPGIRSGDKGPRQALGGAYWLGVACLLFAAIEATIVFPLSRNVPWARHLPWAAGVSIGLAATALMVFLVLVEVVGQERRDRLPLWGPLWGLGVCVYIATLILITGVALGIGPAHWPGAWLSGKQAAVIYALLLAILGGCLVSRTRGIAMGLLIQGHDKTGADDAGLGAFVRARLYSLGSQEPKGILVTQQTDTSTLPSGALGLIPSGNLAKLAALFLSLFAPPTPWRIDVTEQDDGSIVIAVRRNGRVAEAAVIRPSSLELPSKQANGANGGADAASSTPAAGADPSGSDAGGTGAPGDWTTELRMAAATFTLLCLSKRYYHLRAGLCGATEWRSVALQVIASDPESRLSAKDKHAVLVHAVADDRENKAAELALLNDCYRTASSTDDLTDFATKLKQLLDRLPDNEGTLPLRLRSCFNMIVARVNYAALLTGEQPAEKAVRRNALLEAKEQALFLLGFWSKEENRDKYTALFQSMYAAANFAAKAITAELRRLCGDKEAGIDYVEESDLPAGVNMTLLARYENACALTRGRTKQGSAKVAEYNQALGELEIAVADPAMLMWARSDPSLAELHDFDRVRQACSAAQQTPQQQAQTTASAFKIVARFKDLVGEPVPADFLSLSPFAAYRDALALRGIHDAARLRQTRDRELRSEISVTRGQVARWREVTDLYQMAGIYQAADGNGNRATGAVFLLLMADLDSVAAVTSALASPAQLREDLRILARGWAVVAPGEEEICTWGRHLGVP
jgi:hypothetical protein